MRVAAEHLVCRKSVGKRQFVGQKPCPGRLVTRLSKAFASAGNTAEDENDGFEEIRTNPVCVSGQVRKRAAVLRSNQAVTSA